MAFERGTLDDQDEAIQARLTSLKRQTRQLRGRKAQLEFELEQPPTTPKPAELDLITRKIEEIITDGDHLAKKALFEALIEEIEIDSDEALTPSFRIPIMRDGEGWPSTDQPQNRREPMRFAHCHLGWSRSSVWRSTTNGTSGL